jgi:hypothetical protein
VEINSIKIDAVLSFETDFSGSAANDHQRLLVYELETTGGETLVLTSDQFIPGSTAQTLIAGDENNASTPEFLAADGTYYRVDVVSYDSGETVEVVEEEHYLYVRPSEMFTSQPLVTTGSAPSADAVDASSLERLLYILGHNVQHGEFLNTTGYTTSRTIRGFNQLSETEAAEKLEDSEAPDEIGTAFKSKLILAVGDDNNELSALEQEQTVV